MDPLEPYQPPRNGPWDRAAAAHLLRRAGFCPSEAELRQSVDDGLDGTLDRLLNSDRETERFTELDELGAALATREQIEPLRGWWLQRMTHTSRPLVARMAAFWHNHFATSNAKVRSPALMLQQLRTIERHALGSFETLLLAIARDPAMIVWLDGNENVKGRPNENFARELFELFSLGVGNYSEHDIRQAARAFTGWHQRKGVYHFSSPDHDDGDKSVLGATGRLDGGDVVKIALATPACAAFLATKLLREFLTPAPSADLVDALAGVLRESKFDLKSSLRTLLGSRAMFDAKHRRSRIKSPVELVIGLARSLELRAPAGPLSNAVSQMGQVLFEPPSVKGWDGHRAWLDSATMLVRLSAADRAVIPDYFDAAALRTRYDLADREAILRFAAEITLDGAVPEGVAAQIRSLDAPPDDLLRQSLRLLMSTPEYQMA